MTYDEFLKKITSENKDVETEYNMLGEIYDLVTTLGKGPEMCQHITGDNIEVITSLTNCANCNGTNIDEEDITITGRYINMYLLVNVIAYRLAVGDLKLVEVGDIGKKKQYYDELVDDVRRDMQSQK